MDKRVRGHCQLLDELKVHPMLGKLLLGVIPMNEAISYAYQAHRSIFYLCPALTRQAYYIYHFIV